MRIIKELETDMIILPAIDLFKGEAVRLERGDYSRMTVFSSDPAAVARSFEDADAAAIHVVDLEGARDGVPMNFEVVKSIAGEVALEIQVGGGIRSADTIEKYLSAGVHRVILGTAAASSLDFVSEMVQLFGSAVAVGVDIKDERVAIKGWTDVSEHNAIDFCLKAENLGVQTLIITDISKDGMLSGTNIGLYRTMRSKLSINLIASGGVTSLDDVIALSELGMDGAIIGRAIYSGSIDLSQALSAAEGSGNVCAT